MTGESVLVISDIHTHYGVINSQIEHAEVAGDHPVQQVLVLGDFGFFDDELFAYFRRGNNRFKRPVACIDGNHEDHAALHDLADRYGDVVTYLPRGSVHHVGCWRGLCLGGARYMDAWSTPRGCEITRTDLDASLAHPPGTIDLVLTHDCPTDLGVPNTPGLEHYGPPGVPQLAQLAERYRPRWWLFGHHHRWFDSLRGGTRYIGLPRSWEGYVLLHADGELERVEHAVSVGTRPWWKQWLGLK